ncbi:ribosomal protein S18-alanine N-acetyltransferase [Williamsia sterculiae]|uniref:Ribosomal-protein-alanine N-acetyltransferase n=1 Tax=Williamsia sterculiae TaxID=1344003 RepID=A0A1N7DUG7_9NOCA|nr:ribosomal protein S18-alanine N-acetyltransferase [Williamsia sterculiae]SIR79507.1 ribosomal-protein-alanine N-acetyltransferase [Williamsia sterculiae]
MTAILTALHPTDAPRCAEIETAVFGGDSPWPAAAFRAEIAEPHNRYVALRSDDRLIGYAGISVLGPVGERECEIHTIAVDADHRGRGHGHTLLRALLDVADAEHADVFLEVRTDNDAAIALYDHHGFTRMGLRRNYYQPSGADAYTMRRPAGGDGGRT